MKRGEDVADAWDEAAKRARNAAIEQRLLAAMERRRLLRLAKEQEAAADLQLVTEQELSAAQAACATADACDATVDA